MVSSRIHRKIDCGISIIPAQPKIDPGLKCPAQSDKTLRQTQHHSLLQRQHVMCMQPEILKTGELQFGHFDTIGFILCSTNSFAPETWQAASWKGSPHLKQVSKPQEQMARLLQQQPGLRIVFSQPGLAHHLSDLDLPTRTSSLITWYCFQIFDEQNVQIYSSVQCSLHPYCMQGSFMACPLVILVLRWSAQQLTQKE